jgi:hypothetical protein
MNRHVTRSAYRISVGTPEKERQLRVGGKFHCITGHEVPEG